MHSLLIASHNPGKIREIAELLQSLGIAVRSAAELGLPEPEETGATFAENAALKAHAAAKAANLPALADDSGMGIPALQGAPGIYSARWAGPGKDFSIAFARIERELQALGLDARAQAIPAYFICTLCLAWPQGKEMSFEGRVDGTLTFPPRGEKGFGYDPIFTPESRSVTFAEMPPAEKHAISHRARAFAHLKTYLEQI